MTLTELQKQALELPIGDRWRLVQSLLSSIQQETLDSNSLTPNVHDLKGIAPWTQSLIGVIQLGSQEPTDSYVDYLEEKYS
jgi:hypothetical protein